MSKLPIKQRISATARSVDHVWFALFAIISLCATVGLLVLSDEQGRVEPILNAALSIGTGGLVAFIFYFVVNVRTDRRKSQVVHEGNLSAYRLAKRNIAMAVLHASIRGGRDDLSSDTETLERCLTISGFRELFESGSLGHEGYYAFQNQMSDRTYEFSEIILNLKAIETAAERLIASGTILDEEVYKRLVSLSHIIRRIEMNGAGYDESKRLCQFIWEMFAGWNWRDGQLDHDPVEKAFLEAS